METRTFKGTLEYVAKCRGGLHFSNPITFTVHHPLIERVCLESKNTESINLIFSTVDVSSLEEACKIANHFLDKILNIIAFLSNAYIGIPAFSYGTIVEEITSEDGIKSYRIHPSPLRTITKVTWQILGSPPHAKMKSLLDGLQYENDLKDHYYSEYRFILLNKEVAGKNWTVR